MATTTSIRDIDAPLTTVFDTIAHIENFSKAVDHITDVEFLTETTRGVGTRFRETRVMRGREASTVLEVTEYEPDDHIRLVSDEGGTVWDTVFAVTETPGGTRLFMTMDARPHKLHARIITPLMKGVIAKAIRGDLDAVKVYCESLAEGRA